MSGSIKVNGTYQAVDSAYVKVSGAWKAVTKGFVKVDGTWKQWHAANVTDTFNRSNASSLGTCSNGVASWTATTGSWSISSNQVTSATSTSSYPLATITSTTNSVDNDIRVDIPAGAGQGVAFWVTNTNNWYAVVTDLVTTNNYSCPGGGTLSGTNCVTTSTYNATASTYNCGLYTSGSYTYAATANTGYGHIFTGCNGSGACAGSDTICINHTCYDIYTYYTCNPGDADPSGTTCTHYYTSCTTGGSDPCQTCTSYSCSSGDTLSGTICTHSSTTAATNTPSYTYFTRIIQKSSGTVSTLASFSHSAAVRSLRVVTLNNTVTASAYSEVGQAGLMNANSYTATTPTKTAVTGMVLSPANSSQGTTLDNFYIK
jgi:hypothetical protein